MLTQWIDVIEDKGGNDVPTASKHISLNAHPVDCVIEDKGGNEVPQLANTFHS